MSKKARPREKDRTPPAAAETASPGPAPDFRPPLKPRPRLFYSLLAVLAAWVIGLLVLYATTVYPNRLSQQRPQADPAETAEEAVSR